jgi:hypothetical protein
VAFVVGANASVCDFVETGALFNYKTGQNAVVLFRRSHALPVRRKFLSSSPTTGNLDVGRLLVSRRF